MPEPIKSKGRWRTGRTDDPIVKASQLSDPEVMGVLNALSLGMGYADTDLLPDEKQAEYKRIAQDLLMWCTNARVQATLVEMAISGEVMIRWSKEGWMFQKIGDKAN